MTRTWRRYVIAALASGLMVTAACGPEKSSQPEQEKGIAQPAAPLPDAETAASLAQEFRRFLEARIPRAEYKAAQPRKRDDDPFWVRFDDKDPTTQLQTSDPWGQPRPGGPYTGYYAIEVDVAHASGTGGVMALVGRRDPAAFSQTGRCPQRGPMGLNFSYTCSAGTGPAGENVVIETFGANGVVRHKVEVMRPSGTGAEISASNVRGQDPNGRGGLPAGAAPAPPLTADEAKELALLLALRA